MDTREYRILEYEKIKALLAAEAASAMTKAEIEELRPFVSPHIIKQKLAETTEAVSVIMRKGALPLGNFDDVLGLVTLAEKGGVLSMRGLLDIGRHLMIGRKAAQFLKTDLPELEIIDGIVSVIAVNKRLEERIEMCILSEHEMADNASPELKRIRRSIAQQNDAVRAKLNQILNSSTNKTMLQDSIVTMRQGRYVIPVKQEHKAKFPGMVHDQSSTGATLFIEPQAIVNMNNELRELELAEEREIERILAELSAEVAECGHDIANNQDLLIKLDMIFAKGRLSVNQKAAEADINIEGRLRIKNGRHPLIPDGKVVPINLSLGKDYKTLIITGPNTGGKTVTLKTVGLFVLMTASGLHVPADSQTEIPVMSKVFADIGDEQSIEQSLSTFSSHMTNIVSITEKTDENTLVLLDELGAGTDPAEGAALAIAILETLKESGALILATTHYTELKKYAIQAEGVENASMEFDVETLSPTYKLKIGTPGRSNAFEISKKLGLGEAIIDRAASLLDTADIRFESVLASIEADRKSAEDERDEAMLLHLQMKKEKESWSKEMAKLEEKKEKILGKAKEEARDIIADAKTVSDEVQRELRHIQDYSGGDRQRMLDENRRRLREADGRYREKMVLAENPEPISPDDLQEGDRVKIISLDQNGIVLSPADEKGEVQVQAGRMKINVALSGLMKIQESGKKKNAAVKSKSYGGLYKTKVNSISPTIDVRGENLDSAIADVDKYLDDAFMAGLRNVTIIHGRGEGVLREGLQKMMRSHKHVKSCKPGAYSEGGDGVTVCTIKD